jgi:hypothetical protein
VTKLVLDGDKSRVKIRTFAEGLFARLAHDLELVCGAIEGSAEHTEPGKGSATLAVPIDRIDVAGPVKDGRVDPNGISPSDRRDILDKMRKDVFHAGPGATVRIEATIEALDPSPSASRTRRARMRVLPPHGKTVERSISVQLEENEGTRVTGSVELSLSAIGASTVKGPMNAFRVKDAIEVVFDLVFKAG